jgi:hypothetical protein
MKKKNKPGYKTTEFWLTITGAVGSSLAASAGVLPIPFAGQIAAGLIMVYTVARAAVKFKNGESE